MIRLSKSLSKRYQGVFEYLIAYDYSSGNSNRYRVLVLNADDPVTVGRELPLNSVRELISDYENQAKKLPCWIGERKDVLLVMKQVSKLRKKQ
jgi:hypothetical protein